MSEESEMVRKGEWLLCKSCDGQIEFDSQTFIGKCDECWSKIDVKEQTSQIKRIMSSLSEAVELIESKNRYQAEQHLLNMQRQLSDLVHPQSVYICAIKRELSRCHEELGEWQKAVEYRTQCLIIVETVFGDKSFEMLLETKKLSDLYFEFIQSVEERFQVLSLARSCLVATSKAAKLVADYPQMAGDLGLLNERLAYLLLLENATSNICVPKDSSEVNQLAAIEAETM